MSNKSCALALSAALLTSACASSHVSDDGWVYALSRAAYGDGSNWIQPVPSCPRIDNPCEAAVVVAVFLLPFAVDTVLLPITIPHDLMYVR